MNNNSNDYYYYYFLIKKTDLTKSTSLLIHSRCDDCSSNTLELCTKHLIDALLI